MRKISTCKEIGEYLCDIEEDWRAHRDPFDSHAILWVMQVVLSNSADKFYQGAKIHAFNATVGLLPVPFAETFLILFKCAEGREGEACRQPWNESLGRMTPPPF